MQFSFIFEKVKTIMTHVFKIDHLNIHESYFKGKVLKLPFQLKKKQKVLVRFSGPNNLAVEDLLPFEGESKWFEVNSTSITFFIVDHQDESDTLEIINDLAEA